MSRCRTPRRRLLGTKGARAWSARVPHVRCSAASRATSSCSVLARFALVPRRRLSAANCAPPPWRTSTWTRSTMNSKRQPPRSPTAPRPQPRPAADASTSGTSPGTPGGRDSRITCARPGMSCTPRSSPSLLAAPPAAASSSLKLPRAPRMPLTPSTTPCSTVAPSLCAPIGKKGSRAASTANRGTGDAASLIAVVRLSCGTCHTTSGGKTSRTCSVTTATSFEQTFLKRMTVNPRAWAPCCSRQRWKPTVPSER